VIPAFLESLEVAARLVRSPAVGAAWESPSALDGYTVGGLCGHTYQSVRRLVELLDDPPDAAAPTVAPGEYYLRPASADPGAGAADDAGVHASLRAGGEELAASGPEALGERLDALRTELETRLSGAPPSTPVAVLTMPGSASRLDDYLDTRFVELVVHVDDVASSVDVAPPVLPAEAYERCLVVLQDLAMRRAGPAEVVRAYARPERARADALRSI
jgi:hypothetical protein